MNINIFCAVYGALLAFGCDALQVAPGHDFDVRVMTRLPILVGDQLRSVPVEFEVNGCDDFKVSLVHNSDGSTGPGSMMQGSSVSYVLEPVKQSDGTWIVHTPPGSMGPATQALACPFTDVKTSPELRVTCLDQNRSAAAALQVSYRSAPNVMVAPRGFFAFHASPHPFNPFYYTAMGGLFMDIPNTRTTWMFNVEADWMTNVMAVTSDGVFVPGTCPFGCAPMKFTNPRTGAAVETSGTSLAFRPHPPSSTSMLPSTAASWESVLVPGRVVDLALDGEGHLFVLSSLFVAPAGSTVVTEATTISRIVLPPQGQPLDQREAQVIAYFVDEVPATRFGRTTDGTMPFATRYAGEDSRLTVHRVSVDAVSSDAPRTLPGNGVRKPVSMSPDGESIVAVGDSGFFLSDRGSEWVPLATTFRAELYDYAFSDRNVTWTPEAVAVWSLSEGLEVFARRAPHASLFRRSGWIGQVTSIRDHFILTTTGLEVIEPDGTQLLKADPLPCGVPSTEATPVGPSTIALGAGRFGFVFDLSEHGL